MSTPPRPSSLPPLPSVTGPSHAVTAVTPEEFLELLDPTLLGPELFAIFEEEKEVVSNLTAQAAVVLACVLKAVAELEGAGAEASDAVPVMAGTAGKEQVSMGKLKRRMRVGIIGGGKVGLRLAMKLLKLGLVSPSSLVVKSRNAEEAERVLAHRLAEGGMGAVTTEWEGEEEKKRETEAGVLVTERMERMKDVGMICLCVRPSQLVDVVEEMQEAGVSLPPFLFSFLAGTNLPRLRSVFKPVSGYDGCTFLRAHFKPDATSVPDPSPPSSSTSAGEAGAGMLDLAATQVLLGPARSSLDPSLTFTLRGLSHGEKAWEAGSIMQSTVVPVGKRIAATLMKGASEDDAIGEVGKALFGLTGSEMKEVRPFPFYSSTDSN